MGRDDGLAGTRGKARAEGPRYAKVSAACGQSGAPCPLQAWVVKTGGPAPSQADTSPAPAAPPVRGTVQITWMRLHQQVRDGSGALQSQTGALDFTKREGSASRNPIWGR